MIRNTPLTDRQRRMHVYTHPERIAAAKACSEYRERWGLGVADMARQMGVPPDRIEDVENGRYGAGMARLLGKLLVKDLRKKPRKIRA